MTSENMSPEEIARMHQRSFRVAFDFLASHYPPLGTEEYWMNTSRDVGQASEKAGNNKLAIELLSGVLEYLSAEDKARKNG